MTDKVAMNHFRFTSTHLSSSVSEQTIQIIWTELNIESVYLIVYVYFVVLAGFD